MTISDDERAVQVTADRDRPAEQLGNGADVLAHSAGPLRDIAIAIATAAGTERTLPAATAGQCGNLAASLREVAASLDACAGPLGTSARLAQAKTAVAQP